MEKYSKFIILLLATLLIVQSYINLSVTGRDHYQVRLGENFGSETKPLNISDPVLLFLESRSMSQTRTPSGEKLVISYTTVSVKPSVKETFKADTWTMESSKAQVLIFTQKTGKTKETIQKQFLEAIPTDSTLTPLRKQSNSPILLQKGYHLENIHKQSPVPTNPPLVPNSQHSEDVVEESAVPENPFLRQKSYRINGTLRPLATMSERIRKMLRTAGPGNSPLVHQFTKARPSPVSPVQPITAAMSLVTTKAVWGVKPTISHRLVKNIKRLEKQNDRSRRAIASLEDRLNDTINSIVTPVPACPSIPPGLSGKIYPALDIVPLQWIEKLHPELEPGGRWRPKSCVANHRVAIIIPYRNRMDQLVILLRHLHPFLQKQQLDYTIFVVELAEPTTFNRGLLLNVGFEEARRLYNYQCYIFHDVDLLPEDDRNIYSCPSTERPRHLSVAISTLQYRLPYTTIFGGASVVTAEQFFKVNGFPNRYFGWGAEDDDLSRRLRNNGYRISRYPAEVGRYKMIRHQKQTRNPERFKLLEENLENWRFDGLSSLKYRLLKLELRNLYTWVFVSVDEQEIMRQGQPKSWNKT